MVPLLLVTVWTATAIADPTSPTSGFTFTVSGGDLTITGCSPSCSGGSIVIPSSIGGDPVTSIGSQAFYNNLLTSVTIGSSVTSIGYFAFAYNHLTSVTIPSSATAIGQAAFANNLYLTSVTIGSSVTSIADSAFESDALTSVTIPSSVTSIGSNAFSYNSLTSVSFLGSAPSFGTNAFYPSTGGLAYYNAGTSGWGALPSGTLSPFTLTAVPTSTPTTLTMTTPSSGTSGGAIAASSLSAVLASGSSPTGTITITVFGPQSSAPTSCASGGTTVGTATVTGNATYNPSAGYTPSTAGDFWWYASYGGDSNNSASVSTCGSGMVETVITPITVPPPTPTTFIIPTTTTSTTTTTTTTTTTIPPTTTTTQHKATTTTTSHKATTTTTIPPTTTTTQHKATTTTTQHKATTTTTSPSTTTTTTPTRNSGPGSTGVGNTGTAPGANTGTTVDTLPSPPSGDVDILLTGQPGISITDSQVQVHGHGFRPGSTVTIVAHSTPTELGTALVNKNGSFDTAVGMPSGLQVGGHHIIVYGTMQDGRAVAQQEAFTVATGGLLGSVGSIPPGSLAKDVAFVPTSHPALVLATIAAMTTAIGAVSLALGRGAGGAGSGSGSSRGGDGALEDVELEREEHEVAGGSRGDRSGTWRWPGTRRLDHFSKHLPARFAAISPVAGRVLVDGDYLRAMLGSAWLVLCLGAIGLGTYASASTGWYAFPPALGLFLAILGLGVLDSTLGYLAGIAFLVSAALAGHLFEFSEIRLGAGIVLLWFAVPLAASALRPLRRNVQLDIASIWERAADFVIGGLFAAWAAQKMTGALSGLAGVELPINKSVNVVAFAVLGFIAIRIAFETIAAHNYPVRLEVVHHHGDLESNNLQVGLSLIVQILLFIFISIAFLGSNWALYVGAAVFFSPLVPWLFADKIPKSIFVTKWKPRGLVLWTLIIVTGVLLSKLLSHLIHDDKLLEAVGFILLPLPILIAWALELFEDEDEGEEDETAHEDVEVRIHEHEGIEVSVDDSNGQPLTMGSSGVALMTRTAPSVMTATLDVRSTYRGRQEFDENSKGHFREAEEARFVEEQEEQAEHAEHAEGDARLKMWLMRLAGVPLVALCVYLVVAHIASG